MQAGFEAASSATPYWERRSGRGLSRRMSRSVIESSY